MAISKVVYGQNVLIDLTADTVTSGTMVTGTTAHAADGTALVGGLKRAYMFTQTDGDNAVFVLPISGGSVTGGAWSAVGVGASVSGTQMIITG